MQHLARTYEGRLAQVEALLHGNAFRPDHLKITRQWLRDTALTNFSRYEREYGEGAHSRLILAFEYAIWRLEHENRIHPDDYEIIAAYYALPRFTGSYQDDGVDFKTPHERLKEALQAPLDMSGTPRDPALQAA